jgi:hypothetical protein
MLIQLKTYFFKFFWYTITAFALLVIAEGISDSLEQQKNVSVGKGGKRIPHDTLGFVPQTGTQENRNQEYQNRLTINAYHMNDTLVTPERLQAPQRIMVLGDSHTYGVGVSTHQTFSWQLDELLYQHQNSRGTVFNCGVVGYSIGQYLLRYRQLRQLVRPTVVVIGFSAATDLYDLLPPQRGGFIYGENLGRVYHDLDSKQQLVELYDLVGKKITSNSLPTNNTQQPRKYAQFTLLSRFKQFVKNRSLYRRFKSSSLALSIVAQLSFKEINLWEGVETAIAKDLSKENAYRWQLAAQLLRQLAQEAQQDSTQVILLNVPYYPIVNDNVWNKSFGQNKEKYDREICSKRLTVICDTVGISYIDATPLFRYHTNELQQELHYPYDKHPTPLGHQLLAEILAKHIKGLQ